MSTNETTNAQQFIDGLKDSDVKLSEQEVQKLTNISDVQFKEDLVGYLDTDIDLGNEKFNPVSFIESAREYLNTDEGKDKNSWKYVEEVFSVKRAYMNRNKLDEKGILVFLALKYKYQHVISKDDNDMDYHTLGYGIDRVRKLGKGETYFRDIREGSESLSKDEINISAGGSSTFNVGGLNMFLDNHTGRMLNEVKAVKKGNDQLEITLDVDEKWDATGVFTVTNRDGELSIDINTYKSSSEFKNGEREVRITSDNSIAIVAKGDKSIVKQLAAVQEEVVEEQTDEEAVVEEQTDEEAVVEEQTDEEAVVEEQTDEEAVVEEQTDEEAVVEEQTDEEAVVEEQTDEEAVEEEQVQEDPSIRDYPKMKLLFAELDKFNEAIGPDNSIDYDGNGFIVNGNKLQIDSMSKPDLVVIDYVAIDSQSVKGGEGVVTFDLATGEKIQISMDIQRKRFAVDLLPGNGVDFQETICSHTFEKAVSNVEAPVPNPDPIVKQTPTSAPVSVADPIENKANVENFDGDEKDMVLNMLTKYEVKYYEVWKNEEAREYMKNLDLSTLDESDYNGIRNYVEKKMTFIEKKKLPDHLKESRYDCLIFQTYAKIKGYESEYKDQNKYYSSSLDGLYGKNTEAAYAKLNATVVDEVNVDSVKTDTEPTAVPTSASDPVEESIVVLPQGDNDKSDRKDNNIFDKLGKKISSAFRFDKNEFVEDKDGNVTFERKLALNLTAEKLQNDDYLIEDPQLFIRSVTVSGKETAKEALGRADILLKLRSRMDRLISTSEGQKRVGDLKDMKDSIKECDYSGKDNFDSIINMLKNSESLKDYEKEWFEKSIIHKIRYLLTDKI